jgi:hypothetical protein
MCSQVLASNAGSGSSTAGGLVDTGAVLEHPDRSKPKKERRMTRRLATLMPRDFRCFERRALAA